MSATFEGSEFPSLAEGSLWEQWEIGRNSNDYNDYNNIS